MDNDYYFDIRKDSNGLPCVSGDKNVFKGHQIENPKNSHGKSIGGHYLVWEWDGTSFFAQNDFYGTIPCFYCIINDRLVVSTSLIKLIALDVPRDLDDEAISVFVALGWYLYDETPFKHIKVLKPNSKLIWNNGKTYIETTEYTYPKLYTGTVGNVVDDYIDLFRESISLRHPKEDNYMIPITGGKDTRHILLELLRQKVIPKNVFTVGSPGAITDMETKIAKKLTDELNINHTVVSRDRYITKEIFDCLKLTHVCSDEITELMPILNFVDRNNITTTYDGIAGDVFSTSFQINSNRLRCLKNNDYKGLAKDIIHPNFDARYKVINEYLGNEVNLHNYDFVHDRILGSIESYSHSNNPLISFCFWTRTCREINLSPFGLLNNMNAIYCPYLHLDLFDFFMSLPAEMIAKEEIHTKAIHKAYPEYSHIPFMTTSNVAIKKFSIENLSNSIKEIHYNCFVSDELCQDFEKIMRKDTIKKIVSKLTKKNVDGMEKILATYCVYLKSLL